MGNLHISGEYWLQTYQIYLPNQITKPKGFFVHVNKQSCSKLNCQFLQSLLNQIHGIQDDTYSHVSKTLEFLKSVVPYHKINKKGKLVHYCPL